MGWSRSPLQNVSRPASLFALPPSLSTLSPLAQNPRFSTLPRVKSLCNNSTLTGIARCSRVRALPRRYSLLRPHVLFPALHTKHPGSRHSLMLNPFETANYRFVSLTSPKRELSRVDIRVSALTVNPFTLHMKNYIRWLSLMPGLSKTARYHLASLVT